MWVFIMKKEKATMSNQIIADQRQSVQFLSFKITVKPYHKDK